MANGSATPGAPKLGTQAVPEVIHAFRPSRVFKAHDSRTSITSLDFDDTGELAVIARDDDTLQIYNCREGKHAKELKSHKYGVHLARFSHHTQSVIYASTKIDDTIRFLSVHDNSFIRYFKGHTDLVTNITLCPSNDTFLSCSRDNTVLLWNLQSQNYQGKLKLATPYLAAYDAAALVIAIASPSTSHIMLYDIRNYDQGPFGEFDMGRYEEQFLTKGAEWTKLEFTNDGKHLILSTTGAGHFVLDAFEGHLVHFAYRKEGHSGRVGPAITPPSRIPGQRDGITATAGQGDTCVSPDGRYLLGGTGESAIAIWDISKEPASNQYLQPFDHLPGRGKAPIVGYNPRVNLLVSGDKDLYMWQPDPEMM